MTATAAPVMTTAALLARLERHYIKPGESLPGGVFLPEVTKTDAERRRVDALYVGFTSSRGHLLTGHELKVSRADWLHELDQPDKAEAWAPQCHAWVVAAPSIDVVRPEELPHGWGLMVPNARSKTRMDTVVKPTAHPERCPDWVTVHSILKRMDTLRANAILAARQAAQDTAHEQAEAEVERRVEAQLRRNPDAAAEVERLRARLAAIEGALGMDVATDEPASAWRNDVSLAQLRDGVGRYLKADRDVGRALDHLEQRLRVAASQLGYHHADVTEGLAALKKARAADGLGPVADHRPA